MPVWEEGHYTKEGCLEIWAARGIRQKKYIRRLRKNGTEEETSNSSRFILRNCIYFVFREEYMWNEAIFKQNLQNGPFITNLFLIYLCQMVLDFEYV